MPLNYREGKNRYEFPNNFEKRPGVSTFLNPGSVATLYQKSYNLLPTWLEGVQLNFKKNLSTSNAITWSSTLSHCLPSGFRFGFSHYNKHDNDVLVSAANCIAPLFRAISHLKFNHSLNFDCLENTISQGRYKSILIITWVHVHTPFDKELMLQSGCANWQISLWMGTWQKFFLPRFHIERFDELTLLA